MKLKMLFFGCAAVILLSGCSVINENAEKIFLQKAEIQKEEDYKEYEKYLKNNQLSEDGTYDYIRDEGTKTDIGKGNVHITFADNHFLDIQYYLDEALTQEIEADEYNLNPGDSVYAVVRANNRAGSNLYHFKEYQVFEYTENGERKKIATTGEDGGFIYTIPTDFMGTELSIQPIGEYEQRTFDSLYVYYRDGVNQIGELSNAGKWTVNGSEKLDSVCAVESYILSFDYDDENYFFVSAKPNPANKNPNEVGYVEFPEEDSTEETKAYSIELHKLIDVKIRFDEDGKISINDGEQEKIKKGKEWERSNLKYGDKIVIETKGDPEIQTTESKHIKETNDPIKDGTRYTIVITEDMQRESDQSIASSYAVNFHQPAKYGTCIYRVDGKEVKGISTVGENQKLTVTYKIEKEGYIFADKSAGLVGLVSDFIKSKERTVEIPVDASLEGKTLCPEDYFNIVKKGK